MSSPRELPIADRARVERLLDALARRLHAELSHPVVLVGIRRRGAPLARALAARLEALSGREVRTEEIRLHRYDDDLTLLHEEPELEEKAASGDLKGATAVVVDDVLYTGRTLLRAVDWALEQGATRVRSVALCSRDAPEVPIRADWTALRLDVGPSAIIEVCVPPFEPELAIVLRTRPDSSA